MSQLNEWSSRKDYYRQKVEEAGCTRYQPCEICYKCKVKASHLFIKCGNCQVPICGHDERARNFMIRRENQRHRLMHFLPSINEGKKKGDEQNESQGRI